jgi:hypothetical protein
LLPIATHKREFLEALDGRTILLSLFPKKPKSRNSGWPTQVADHLVPNRILRFFGFQGERERGKFFVFKGLQKPLSAQIQSNLKMRRSPPTSQRQPLRVISSSVR